MAALPVSYRDNLCQGRFHHLLYSLEHARFASCASRNFFGAIPRQITDNVPRPVHSHRLAYFSTLPAKSWCRNPSAEPYAIGISDNCTSDENGQGSLVQMAHAPRIYYSYFTLDN
jgi:hypothetical protein